MGWIYLALVVAGFVAMNFVMKLGTLKGHSSPALTAALFAAAAALCAGVLMVSGKPVYPSTTLVLLAVGGGVGGAVAYFVFLSALEAGPYALTISIYTMAFLIPVAFSIVVWSRPLGGSTAAGIVLIVAGIALISMSGVAAKGAAKAAWLKWLALVGAAFVLTGIPQLSQAAAARLGDINLWFFLFLTFSAGAVALWVFLIAKKAKTRRGLFGYGTLAAVGSVAGNFFTLRALAKLPEPVVFPVSMAGPIVAAVLLSVFYFREKIKPLGYVGIAAGLAGIVFLALG
ncbi:MAG TPA: DMT family transporter [Candidatus Bathyarchaeia archaeon]|nr:DMT family transporter [Candidatus Bathyarchaeia archaeon]